MQQLAENTAHITHSFLPSLYSLRHTHTHTRTQRGQESEDGMERP